MQHQRTHARRPQEALRQLDLSGVDPMNTNVETNAETTVETTVRAIK